MSIAVAPIADFVRELGSARQVALTAYTLRPGPVLDGLAAAAARGADVRVRLERDPMESPGEQTLHHENAAAVARLSAAGARASLTGPAEPRLHLKAAVVDGVAWLDDRNWAAAGAQHLIRDTDADDVAAVTSAVAGGPGRDGHLATTKDGALALEADVIASAGAAPLAVESESFGNGLVYDRLLERARAGQPTRLIVAGREFAEAANHRERAELAHLSALGVEVRVGPVRGAELDEKMALAADVWLGSANATYARGPDGEQRDWGLATRVPAIGDELRRAFEANWAVALPLAAAQRAVLQ